MLGRIGEAAGAIPGGGGEFHLIVLQHTNCGITYLAGETAMLTGYFQIAEGELKKKAATDPRAAVAVDVALLRTIHALPGEWLISGLVYDVATGLVEIVDAASSGFVPRRFVLPLNISIPGSDGRGRVCFLSARGFECNRLLTPVTSDLPVIRPESEGDPLVCIISLHTFLFRSSAEVFRDFGRI